MRYAAYELEMTDSLMVFEFTSIGPKGAIKKRVHYETTSRKDTYNLAFGDLDVEANDFDDAIRTNNRDREKVLATVAATVIAFLSKYPDTYVYAKGGSPSRTRLYRMAISSNLEEISTQFYIYGLVEDMGWVTFEKNTYYSAFLIKLKKK